MHTSCHPASLKRSLAYSLVIRIKRITSVNSELKKDCYIIWSCFPNREDSTGRGTQTFYTTEARPSEDRTTADSPLQDGAPFNVYSYSIKNLQGGDNQTLAMDGGPPLRSTQLGNISLRIPPLISWKMGASLQDIRVRPVSLLTHS